MSTPASYVVTENAFTYNELTTSSPPTCARASSPDLTARWSSIHPGDGAFGDERAVLVRASGPSR